MLGNASQQDRQMAQAMAMAAANPAIELENTKEFMALWTNMGKVNWLIFLDFSPTRNPPYLGISDCK